MSVIRKMGVAMIILGASGGCGAHTWLDGISEIPAGVAKVEEMSEEFALISDHPLSEIPAGTVLDDISGLDGCWGAYAGSDLIDPFHAYAHVLFFEFDLEAARVTRQSIHRGARQGVLSVLIPLLASDYGFEVIYSLEIVGPDRVVVQKLSQWSCSNIEIERIEDPGCGEVSEYDDSPIVEWLVTLDDDSLIVGSTDEGAGGELSPVFPFAALDWVFARFPCPE